jgi:hypothetical protein
MLETTKLKRYVSIVDPALDKVPEEVMREYGRYRKIDVIEKYFDRTNMPVIFYARAIPRSVWNRFVMAQTIDDLKAQACFQFGIVKVDNLPTEDGVRIGFSPTGSMGTADGDMQHITDAEMNRFYPSDTTEIGGCIYMRNFFRPTIDVIYRPPHMSVEQWASQVVLSAAANQTTQAENNETLYTPDTQPPNETDRELVNEEKK